jgi:tetratricopeptide (TPR) repeat protein
MTLKKGIFRGVLILFLGLTGTAGAQMGVERPYWFTLERGKLYFRSGAYGDALLAFDDARTQRRTMYTRMEQDMIELLSIPEVRRLGDSLEQVEAYIADRNQPNAARALEELYYRVPKAGLGGSARNVLTQLNRLKDYPEAEYWIGETYRAEGELGIALRQYQKAYEQRELLEIPGFAVEILYKIVDIHRTRQEYTEMAGGLEEILAGDALWSQDEDTFVRRAMARTLENDGINRFLTLYRYNNSGVLRAHQLLGFYYYTSARHNRAVEHLMFAFLIMNTILIEELSRSQFDYSFTTLDNLLAEAVKWPELAAYLDRLEYFRTLYYLGTSFFGTGKLNTAREFWNAAARRPEAGEWRGRAETQLRSPFMEQALERP